MTTHNTTSQNNFRVLPATEPQSDPVGLWKLQVELLSWAEQLYGPRDASWRIDPPQCAKNIPHVDLAVGRGAFARLAPNAQRHWRFAVFQLAHESVHLLDPVKWGEATYLEEGVAVGFSLHVQRRYGINVVTNDERFDCAYALVSALPCGHLEAKRIRRSVGRLSDATANNLSDLFPDLAPEIAGMLASEFPASSPFAV